MLGVFMKAVVMRAFGGPEVLRLEDVPEPEPAAGEVKIAVRSVSINRSFDLGVRRDGNNRGVQPPLILGADPAGVVTAVGAGVTAFRPGDRVAVHSTVACGTCKTCLATNQTECSRARQIGVHRQGGYADYVCVPERNAHRIPGDLPFAVATIVVRHGPAAFQLIDDKARTKPGEWVLVMGAAGGLGSCCVQAAKVRGARVIAGAGADDRVRTGLEVGADAGVNYRREDLVARVTAITSGEGADVVCDSIADPTTFSKAFECLAQRGRLVTMGAHGGGNVVVDMRRLYGRRLSILGAAGVTAKNFDDALAAAATGKMKGVVARTFPLAQAADAHRLLETGATAGKVILDPTL
jgi:NADPH:quinone reductase-like Zn-dependent oxidoreductase